MKQQFDELGHKVVDTIKQSEEQSDIIDRLQGTVSACSNLHVKPCLAFCGYTLVTCWNNGHIQVTESSARRVFMFVSLILDSFGIPQMGQCCCQRPEVCDARNWILHRIIYNSGHKGRCDMFRWACIEDCMKKR